MQDVSFAKVETVKVFKEAGEGRLVVVFALLSVPQRGQVGQFVIALDQLPRLMGFAGVDDFDDLRTRIVRLKIDAEEEVVDVGGPNDGDWLIGD